MEKNNLHYILERNETSETAFAAPTKENVGNEDFLLLSTEYKAAEAKGKAVEASEGQDACSVEGNVVSDVSFAYPAVFTYEPGQEIAVIFPDLNAATSGVSQENAEQSGRELLDCVLIGLMEDGQCFPAATPMQEIHLQENEKVVLISISQEELEDKYDLELYERAYAAYQADPGTYTMDEVTEMLEDEGE